MGVSADPWAESEGDRKSRPNYPLNADVCETLVRLSPEYQLEPSLANDWEFVGDNTFRFELNEQATFSDGAPVNAEAVKSSIDYTVQEPASGFSFLGPDSTTVIDDQTVEITPQQPNLRLIEQINHPEYSIYAPGSDPLNDPNVICSGPFQVVDYQAEEQLVVERNENYWGEAASLDKITFRFFPDDTTRSLALQNGEVDMITDVPRGILSSLEELPGIKVEESPIGQVMLMYVARRDLAGTEKPLADPLVRRAVAASMNEQAFVDGVLAGNGEVVDTVSPPNVLGEFADIVEGVPYDPDEAGRLLDEAGWIQEGDSVRLREGQPLELTIIFSTRGVDLSVVEFVQAQLEAVGIAGQIEQLDAGAYLERLNSGDYDLDISPPNQNDANPSFLTSLRWYSKATGANAQFISPGPDTEFERLIDQTQQATDETELRRLSAEAMHELVDVEVAGIPLAGIYRIFAMKDEVQGLEPHPSGTNQRWSTVFFAE